MARSIMWFRRDLRLGDNPALAAAASDGEVVGLFVTDPAFARAGAVRRRFLAGCLRSLDDDTGGHLVVREGDPAEVVPALAAEVGADTVFAAEDFAPYGRARDDAVARALGRDDRTLRFVSSPYAIEPGTVTKGDGHPFAVFSPFMRAWRAQGWSDPIEAPDVDWVAAPTVAVPAPGPEADGPDLPEPGEAAAQRRVEEFFAGPIERYDRQRNLVGVDGTSRLSSYLHFGVVHPRQLLARLGDTRAHRVYGNELGWREFYADVLFRRPDTAYGELQPKMGAMRVDTDARARQRFTAWCEGRTGYPIVDAGMRQLLAHGWMHNRMRMVTASFLVKDLHLPWQWGARFFLRHLVCGDVASNSHGWQWVAGTGTDAAPYFRVFNPVLQGEKFDPDGTYVRHFVPELRDRPDAKLHHPSGGLLGDGYPAPIVDHAAERAEALGRYAEVSGR